MTKPSRKFLETAFQRIELTINSMEKAQFDLSKKMQQCYRRLKEAKFWLLDEMNYDP